MSGLGADNGATIRSASFALEARYEPGIGRVLQPHALLLESLCQRAGYHTGFPVNPQRALSGGRILVEVTGGATT